MKINKLEWTIKEVETIEHDVFFLGQAIYNELTILIKENQTYEQKKQTLIHELTHAYLYSYGHQQNENHLYTYEAVCDLFGAFAEDILLQTHDYLRGCS